MGTSLRLFKNMCHILRAMQQPCHCECASKMLRKIDTRQVQGKGASTESKSARPQGPLLERCECCTTSLADYSLVSCNGKGLACPGQGRACRPLSDYVTPAVCASKSPDNSSGVNLQMQVKCMLCRCGSVTPAACAKGGLASTPFLKRSPCPFPL